MVGAGCLLVEINQLHLAVDELCRVEDTRVMLEECERRSDETWGSCNRPGQSHDVARAGQREGLGAFWSSGVRNGREGVGWGSVTGVDELERETATVNIRD